MAVDADTKEVEPSGVDEYERRGALSIVCAAPALAEGTAGVEPAGEAERAMAAKPEALASWVRGETRREVERLPMHEPPQKGRRKLEALPPKGDALPRGRPNKRQTQEWTRGSATGRAHGQGTATNGRMQTRGAAARQRGQAQSIAGGRGSPNEGEHEPDRSPRKVSCEDVLSTWEGEAPWDPGEGPTEDQIFNSKRPVEAKNIAQGIDACHNTRKTLAVQKSSQSKGTSTR